MPLGFFKKVCRYFQKKFGFRNKFKQILSKFSELLFIFVNDMKRKRHDRTPRH